jgi:hypothetical protein
MKKARLPERKTGIWIDQDRAILIRLEGNKEPVIKTVKSDVESRVRIAGEEKVSARFGNTFIDDQEKKQRRQRHERKRYFDEIISLVKEDDYLFLFGPGRGKQELQKAVQKLKGVRARIMQLETTDRMTKNQMLEKTVRYFTGDEFLKAKRNLKDELHVISL